MIDWSRVYRRQLPSWCWGDARTVDGDAVGTVKALWTDQAIIRGG